MKIGYSTKMLIVKKSIIPMSKSLTESVNRVNGTLSIWFSIREKVNSSIRNTLINKI